MVIIVATIAEIQIRLDQCKICPYSMFHNNNGGISWYCIKMKGKTFKDPLIVQEWCPYKIEG